MVVRPPWQEYEPADDDVVVLLDPGMAFGTGTHPTTQIALRLLERLEIANKSVFDVGTGSGIIAIAAAKLGARAVDGVDIDAVSVRQAIANVAMNDARDLVTIWQSDMAPNETGGQDYDIVVANIIARVLIEIADQIVTGCQPRMADWYSVASSIRRKLESSIPIERSDSKWWIDCRSKTGLAKFGSEHRGTRHNMVESPVCR